MSLDQGRYTFRHDRIVQYIVQCLGKSRFEVYLDLEGHKTPDGRTIPALVCLTADRPDIVIIDHQMADLFIWGKKRRVIREGGRFFIPYMDGNPTFDIQRTADALEPLGLAVPRVDDYMGNLLDYCKRTDFGKRVAE